MKKKHLLAALGVVCTCLVICLVIAVFQINEEKKAAGKEDYAVENTTEAETENSSETSEPETTEETKAIEEVDYSEPIEKNGMILEILNYEYVDKLEDYAEYNEGFLYYEDKPEPGTDIRMEKDTDYDAVYKEAPKYEDSEKNSEKYTIEERCAIMEETQSIIDKYTYEMEVPYDYLFVQCRLTNTQNMEQEVMLNEQELAVVKDGTWDYREDHLLLPAYFDKTQKDPTDPTFFCYKMELEEVLEYTVAFPVKEKKSIGVYYYGVPDVITDRDGIPQNPAEQTMYMHCLFQR